MKPAAIETGVPAAQQAAMATGHEPISIVTRMDFAAAPGLVWDALMFYEQIDERPPLLLRLLLPLPIRTEGAKAVVGDEATCLYEGGHLLKRVTQIDPLRHYGFEVVEQRLAIGRGLLLCGGSYVLRDLPAGHTEVAVTTRYLSRKRPRWLWQPLEATVCHLFHRHLLRAIRRKAASRR